MSSNAPPATPDWHSFFPTPSFDTPRISAEDLVELMKTQKAGQDYIVIDLRRNDFEVAFIKGALNLPAQSFYPTLSTILAILSHVPKVIFHCQSCSGQSRGTRAAGWYAEALKENGVTTSESLVLDGGIKGFIAKYSGDDSLMVKLPPI